MSNQLSKSIKGFFKKSPKSRFSKKNFVRIPDDMDESLAIGGGIMLVWDNPLFGSRVSGGSFRHLILEQLSQIWFPCIVSKWYPLDQDSSKTPQKNIFFFFRKFCRSLLLHSFALFVFQKKLQRLENRRNPLKSTKINWFSPCDFEPWISREMVEIWKEIPRRKIKSGFQFTSRIFFWVDPITHFGDMTFWKIRFFNFFFKIFFQIFSKFFNFFHFFRYYTYSDQSYT